MPELVGFCFLFQKGEEITANQCQVNGCVTENDIEYDPLYVCDSCSQEFHRSEGSDESVPHRCDCGKFASLAEDDKHYRCPECLDYGPKGGTISVVLLESGNCLQVREDL